MNLQRIGRILSFLAGTLVGGLALAFVIVFMHPDLLVRRAAPPEARVTAASAPVATPGAAAGIALHEPPESYADAVRRAAPAVVNIYTRRTVTEQVQPSPLEQLFGNVWPRYRQHVQRALGSGVIIDAAGHIITNNHVIENADAIMVQLADGRESAASVVGRDPDTDLAVLQIKLGNLPIMPLGRSDKLQVGDSVLAIGDPLGIGQTVTHGIVSAIGRNQLGVATFENFIQTDAAINAGNSGGALINDAGELVGINTAVAKNSTDVGGLAGIGFAIPVNLARGVLQQILLHGHVIRSWIGIVPEDVDDDQAKRLGLSHGGVVIVNLYVNSPAATAGLTRGDIILLIDGKATSSAQDTLAQIAARKPGSKLKLHILRGSTPMDVTLTTTEQPRTS